MPRSNPTFRKGKSLKASEIPKGLTSGSTFVKKGVRYMVISYTTKTNKRVRFARPVYSHVGPGKKPTKAGRKRITGTTRGRTKKARTKKRNPFIKGETLRGKAIPKGKRSGDCFTLMGVKYMVISYTIKKGKSRGKRVRYARPFAGRRYC